MILNAAGQAPAHSASDLSDVMRQSVEGNLATSIPDVAASTDPNKTAYIPEPNADCSALDAASAPATSGDRADDAPDSSLPMADSHQADPASTIEPQAACLFCIISMTANQAPEPIAAARR